MEENEEGRVGKEERTRGATKGPTKMAQGPTMRLVVGRSGGASSALSTVVKWTSFKIHQLLRGLKIVVS